MESAKIKRTTVLINASKNLKLKATGSTIVFDGFSKIFPLNEIILPKLKEKQTLNLKKIKAEQHETQPPPSI